MKKNIIYTIVFLFSSFVFVTCLFGYFFTFYYTTKEGDKYYHSKVSENIFILNFGKNIESINYCFTDEKSCDDYLVYEGDLSKRFLNVSIDYPDNNDGKRICVSIESSNGSSVRCNDSTYVVDSVKPVITSLYNEVIMVNKEDNLENLFEISSNTGIKDFSCKYVDDEAENVSIVECTAVGNNNLTATYSQKVYISDTSRLEGKKVLFVGDSITAAAKKYDGFQGWAGRIGLSNYMDWYNVGVGGATIAKTDNHITNQLHKTKDNSYDYVILQGGINDMNRGISLGEISDSFEVEDFDNTTFAGGLEELFYYAKEYNPDTKIGFIITYQTPNSTWNENVQNRSEQVELMRKICDKWEIPYLDLYDGVVFEGGKAITYSEILKVDTGYYFHQKNPADVHLSGLGYDVVSKYIDIWMKTL